MRFIAFVLTLLCGCLTITAQSLQLTISNLRNTKGNVRIQFFDNQQHFDDKQPLFTKTHSKADAHTGVLTVSYSGLKPGTYGIAILDDENANEKMDYGLLLPKEGFGFSDYYHTGMSQPEFKKFSFVLYNSTKHVEIKIRYL